MTDPLIKVYSGRTLERLIVAIKPSDTRLPVYARLRDDLTSRIVSGEWSADKPIPSESELSGYYNVSIGTLRKAVDGLVQERLMERRHGSGTYVRSPSFDSTLFRFFQIQGPDNCRTIPSSQLILRAKTTAPKAAQQALHSSEVIKIIRLRGLADQPILYEEIYIPQDRFAGFETLPEQSMGPLLYPIYFEHFGVLVKKAVDVLSFGTATSAVAKQLRIRKSDPVAIIKRTAFNLHGLPVEWRVARGSAAMFSYRSEIS